jgi:hypothetical protein
MAYTDKSGKKILAVFGRCKVPIFATVVKGDLLTYDDSNYGFKLADQSGGLAAQLVACSDGVSGDTIDAGVAVVFETPATESAGVFSDNNMCAAADVGKPFYLSEDGKLQITQGATTGQCVGIVLSRTQGLILPQSYVTGTTMSLSGNATVGGNLAVTGTLAVTSTSTLTGALAINGGATVATGKDLTMVKGNIIFTKGGVQRYVRAVTATDTVLVNDDILSVTPAADTTLTLPDLATAGIGKTFTIIHKATANTVKIVAAGADKIIKPSDGTATEVNITDDKGLDCQITLVALASALWGVIWTQGDWTYA